MGPLSSRINRSSEDPIAAKLAALEAQQGSAAVEVRSANDPEIIAFQRDFEADHNDYAVLSKVLRAMKREGINYQQAWDMAYSLLKK